MFEADLVLVVWVMECLHPIIEPCRVLEAIQARGGRFSGNFKNSEKDGDCVKRYKIE